MTKESVNEFKTMIEHAVDEEELETLRHMLLEATGLTFDEKKEASDSIDRRYKQFEATRH